jgi:Protein phosphatase 2C
MNILAEPFSVPKRGNSEDECDDAVWPERLSRFQDTCARFAVADGATESLFARRWAKILVQEVGESRMLLSDLSAEIGRLRRDWREWIADVKLAWYAEEKARQGTYSALVGLTLWDSGSGVESDRLWQMAALGDSCCFHVRGDEIRVRFPLETSDGFDNRPFLLGSMAGDEQALSDNIARRHGSWMEGDVFYLMTDALACWFLRETEAGNKPLEALCENASPAEPSRFSVWIETLRDCALIRNDDSTLLRISVR